MNWKWYRKKEEVLTELLRSQESLSIKASIAYSDADTIAQRNIIILLSVVSWNCYIQHIEELFT